MQLRDGGSGNVHPYDIGGGSYSCDATADGTDNAKCASTLQVTVTPDAYFDDDSSNAGSHTRKLPDSYIIPLHENSSIE